MTNIRQSAGQFFDRLLHRSAQDGAPATNPSPAANIAPPLLPPRRQQRYSAQQLLGLATGARPESASPPFAVLSRAIGANDHQAIANFGQGWGHNPLNHHMVERLLEGAIRDGKSHNTRQALCQLPGADASRLLRVAVKHRDLALAGHLLTVQGAKVWPQHIPILRKAALKALDAGLMKPLLQQGPIALSQAEANRFSVIAALNNDNQLATLLCGVAIRNNDTPLFNQLLKQIGTLTEAEATELLAIAVRHDNVELARVLLRQRAKPDLQTIDNDTSAPMQELLHAAKMINDLYPKGKSAQPANDTPLDHALQAYDLAQARTLLENIKTAKGIADEERLWRQTGVASPDILRAMLVLKPEVIDKLAAARDRTNENNKQRLLHGGKMNAGIDPALRNVLTRYGYFSEKPGRKLWANNNAEGRFSNGSSIVCGPLAWYWLKEKATDPKGKPSYATGNGDQDIVFADIAFEDKESIEKHMPEDAPACLEALLKCSSRTEIVDRNTFGKDMLKLFQSIDGPMEEGQQKNMLLAMELPAHVMAAELKIKYENGEKWYVLNVYDPNVTGAHKRIKTNDPATLEKTKLQALLWKEELTSRYFADDSTRFPMFVVSPTETWQPMAKRSAPDYGEAGRVMHVKDPIDGATVNYMLRHGFTGNLKRLRDTLNDMKAADAVKLLSHEFRYADSDGDLTLTATGFHMAMQNGVIDSVKAFIDLVNELDILDEDKIGLLRAADADGMSGLEAVLTFGDANTATEFIGRLNGLKLRNPDKLEDAIVELVGNGNLADAMEDIPIESAMAYFKAVDGLKISDKAKLKRISMCTSDDCPAFHRLVQLKQLDPASLRIWVKTIGELKLPDAMKEQLLAGRYGGVSILDRLQENKDFAGAKAYIDEVKKLDASSSIKKALLPESEHADIAE